MPDDRPHAERPVARRARRFVVRDAEDHLATEKIEEFLTGPRTRARPRGPRSIETNKPVAIADLDTRTDFVAALRHEALRTERYGRPATIVWVEVDLDA